jgi:methionine-S-sulfoxide reductase
MMETITLGGGCFWCVEAVFEELKGVSKVESGYSGGHVVNPSYEEVCSGSTGHAEVVQVTFDPKEVSLADLIRIFLTTHDPTQLNRQGNDVGTQYRSSVFVRTPEQKKIVEVVIDEVNKAKIWPRKIVTTIEPFKAYYAAEDYHQNYFKKYEDPNNQQKSTMNRGYCALIIAPKVAKFRKMYKDKLKK